MPRFNRAFTIVELLVVISLIAVLISMLLPSLQSARKVGVSLQCMTNARAITDGNLLYATDYKTRLPTTIFWAHYPPPAGGVANGTGESYWFSPEYSNVTSTVSNVGLLYMGGYVTKWKTFYCPGRLNPADSYSPTYPNNGGNTPNWLKFPNGGWIRDCYNTATSNIVLENTTNEIVVDNGRWHNVDRCDPTKVMTWEINWNDAQGYEHAGISQHQHGMGYNYSFWDGSARFVPDPGNYLETHFDIGYVAGGMSFNTGFNDANATSILYYMMTQQLGWSDAKYKQFMPH